MKRRPDEILNRIKWDVLLALASGGLVGLPLSGLNMPWLAWIGMVPLFIAIRDKGPIGAFGLGFLAGFVASSIVLHWVPSTFFFVQKSWIWSPVVLVLLGLFFSLRVALFCALLNLIRRSMGRSIKGAFSHTLALVIAPSLWVAFEYIHSELFPGLPWTFILQGYSQWSNLKIIQVAEITAIYGISFLVVLANFSLYRAIVEKRILQFGIVFLVLFLSWLYGSWRMALPIAMEENNRVRVAILQGNIEPLKKWDEKEADFLAKTYLELNRKAAVATPDLILWTETAIPWLITDGDDLVEAALRITKPANASHLIGSPAPTGNNSHPYYNAAYFVLPDGQVIGQYNKVRLLTLIERTSFRPKYLRWFQIQETFGRYLPAREQVILRTPLGNIGVSICNENFYPDFIRNSVKMGAEYLVNMTNDAWFPSETMLRQHYVQNIFRAIENRREIAVANNVGISSFIDAYGRSKDKTETRKSTYLVNEIARKHKLSFYTRFGDVFSYLSILFSLLGVSYPLVRKGKWVFRQLKAITG